MVEVKLFVSLRIRRFCNKIKIVCEGSVYIYIVHFNDTTKRSRNIWIIGDYDYGYVYFNYYFLDRSGIGKLKVARYTTLLYTSFGNTYYK